MSSVSDASKGPEWSPLFQEILKPSPSTEKIAILLRSGSSVNEVHAGTGLTPLILAARKGFLPIVRQLLDAGANVNAQLRDDGTTALDGVCRKESSKQGILIDLLLSRGADVGLLLKPDQNKTPLYVAIRKGWWNLVRAKIAIGADVIAAGAGAGSSVATVARTEDLRSYLDTIVKLMTLLTQKEKLLFDRLGEINDFLEDLLANPSSMPAINLSKDIELHSLQHLFQPIDSDPYIESFRQILLNFSLYCLCVHLKGLEKEGVLDASLSFSERFLNLFVGSHSRYSRVQDSEKLRFLAPLRLYFFSETFPEKTPGTILALLNMVLSQEVSSISEGETNVRFNKLLQKIREQRNKLELTIKDLPTLELAESSKLSEVFSLGGGDLADNMCDLPAGVVEAEGSIMSESAVKGAVEAEAGAKAKKAKKAKKANRARARARASASASASASAEAVDVDGRGAGADAGAGVGAGMAEREGSSVDEQDIEDPCYLKFIENCVAIVNALELGLANAQTCLNVLLDEKDDLFPALDVSYRKPVNQKPIGELFTQISSLKLDDAEGAQFRFSVSIYFLLIHLRFLDKTYKDQPGFPCALQVFDAFLYDKKRYKDASFDSKIVLVNYLNKWIFKAPKISLSGQSEERKLQIFIGLLGFIAQENPLEPLVLDSLRQRSDFKKVREAIRQLKHEALISGHEAEVKNLKMQVETACREIDLEKSSRRDLERDLEKRDLIIRGMEQELAARKEHDALTAKSLLMKDSELLRIKRLLAKKIDEISGRELEIDNLKIGICEITMEALTLQEALEAKKAKIEEIATQKRVIEESLEDFKVVLAGVQDEKAALEAVLTSMRLKALAVIHAEAQTDPLPPPPIDRSEEVRVLSQALEATESKVLNLQEAIKAAQNKFLQDTLEKAKTKEVHQQAMKDVEAKLVATESAHRQTVKEIEAKLVATQEKHEETERILAACHHVLKQCQADASQLQRQLDESSGVVKSHGHRILELQAELKAAQESFRGRSDLDLQKLRLYSYNEGFGVGFEAGRISGVGETTFLMTEGNSREPAIGSAGTFSTPFGDSASALPPKARSEGDDPDSEA
jgi:hypothetical protein